MTAHTDLSALMDALGLRDEQLRALFVASQGGSRPQRPVHNAELAETARQLRDSNDALHRQLELLACALGACPDCWGADPDCTECGGIGRPGAFLPDERLFRHFVLPVLRRLSAALAEGAPQASPKTGDIPKGEEK